MAVTITLPGDYPSQDGIVAGISFTGGRARVDNLGPHAAAFLDGIGARLRATRPRTVEQAAEQGDGG